MKINFYFIRHGKTKSNEENKYVSYTDESLSEHGIEDIKIKVSEGLYPKADIIFSSPMKRCIETSELIYPNMTMHIIEEWKEMNFGVFEGFSYKQLNESCYREQYQDWIDSNGTMKIPEGESQKEFIDRTLRGYKKMMKILSGNVKGNHEINIACIVHGGTVMALMSYLNEKSYYDYQLKNGEVLKCQLH